MGSFAQITFFLALYSEEMSIVFLRNVSCIQQNNASSFSIHSLSLCLFNWELSPLLLRDINGPMTVIYCYFDVSGGSVPILLVLMLLKCILK